MGAERFRRAAMHDDPTVSHSETLLTSVAEMRATKTTRASRLEVAEVDDAEHG